MICITVVVYFGDYQYQLGEWCVIYVGEHTNITNIKGLWEGYVNKEFRLQTSGPDKTSKTRTFYQTVILKPAKYLHTKIQQRFYSITKKV